jgi:hypothetical protein
MTASPPVRTFARATFASLAAFMFAASLGGCAPPAEDDGASALDQASSTTTAALDESAIGAWSFEGYGRTSTIFVYSVSPFVFDLVTSTSNGGSGALARAPGTVSGERVVYQDGPDASPACRVALRFHGAELEVDQQAPCARDFASSARADGTYRKVSKRPFFTSSALGEYVSERGNVKGRLVVTSVSPVTFDLSLTRAGEPIPPIRGGRTIYDAGRAAFWVGKDCNIYLRRVPEGVEVAQFGTCAEPFGSVVDSSGLYTAAR